MNESEFHKKTSNESFDDSNVKEPNQDILDKLKDVVISLDAREMSWKEYDEAMLLLDHVKVQLDSSVMMNKHRI